MSRFLRKATAVALSLAHVIHPSYAYDFNAESTASIKSVSKELAADLMSMYNGDKPGQTPGLLPQPYYWWEAGALMGAMIDYWYYTGDDTYNQVIQQGILHQVGPYNDFMPPNQTLTEGNDDQGFWGMAAMSAAEFNFENPGHDQPQWLALAQAVFNTQAARWDTQYCNGGLRWQIFTWNNGYNYKNSISQACFFNLAARLALYTGNGTYADWAIKTWDWMVGVRFIDEHYRIYDGATVEHGCTDITPYEFSYNVGAFLLGAAAMAEYSNKARKANSVALWHERVDGLLNNTELIFFFGNDTNGKVMYEVACETVNLCNVDQQSFKAYLSRWMAATTKWAPWTFGRIRTLLRSSAKAAVKQCTGGDNGRMCGLKWANNNGQWDGTTGVGQQMAVMEVVLANMIKEAKKPFTESTGGTSAGDPSAGGNGDGAFHPAPWHNGHIRAGDRAGAAFITFVILAALLAALVFMLSEEARPADENERSPPTATAAAIGITGAHANTNTIFGDKGKSIPTAQTSDTTAVESDQSLTPCMGEYAKPSPPINKLKRKAVPSPATASSSSSVSPPPPIPSSLPDGEPISNPLTVSHDTPCEEERDYIQNQLRDVRQHRHGRLWDLEPIHH